MIITLDLNLIKDNTRKAYNQEEGLSKMFYYNRNKIENPNDDN